MAKFLYVPIVVIINANPIAGSTPPATVKPLVTQAGKYSTKNLAAVGPK